MRYFCLRKGKIGPVAQGIEQLPSKQSVTGSNPVGITCSALWRKTRKVFLFLKRQHGLLDNGAADVELL